MFEVRFDKERMAEIPNRVRVTGQGVCFNFKVRRAQLEVNQSRMIQNWTIVPFLMDGSIVFLDNTLGIVCDTFKPNGINCIPVLTLGQLNTDTSHQ